MDNQREDTLERPALRDSQPWIGDSDIPAPRLARAILFAVLAGFLLVTALNIMNARLSWPVTLGAGTALALIMVLQIGHTTPGANRAPYSRRAVTLGLQAVFTYLPLIVFRAEWGAMAGFLAGSALLLLPPKPGWSLFALIGLSMVVDPIVTGRSLLDTVYLCESTLLVGIIVYGISRLAELVDRMHAARGELARLAVANERLRFARDLHDLLGYSLSAITLKSELVLRLVASNPERAREEVASVLTISRQSLADVRMVASGYRDMSLVQEASSAQSMLAAADIKVSADIRVGPLAPAVDTVLATVLREGVTNMLRHSGVRSCSIVATEQDGVVRLSLLNDGVGRGHRDSSSDSGSGLGNLATRLESVGGTLTADSGVDGQFLLMAEVPACRFSQSARLEEPVGASVGASAGAGPD